MVLVHIVICGVRALGHMKMLITKYYWSFLMAQHQIYQFDNAPSNINNVFMAHEYNEAWTVMDEEAYRLEICERLDIPFNDLNIDADGIPF
jgi:hypothetical protein